MAIFLSISLLFLVFGVFLLVRLGDVPRAFFAFAGAAVFLGLFVWLRR